MGGGFWDERLIVVRLPSLWLKGKVSVAWLISEIDDGDGMVC